MRARTVATSAPGQPCWPSGQMTSLRHTDAISEQRETLVIWSSRSNFRNCPSSSKQGSVAVELVLDDVTVVAVVIVVVDVAVAVVVVFVVFVVAVVVVVVVIVVVVVGRLVAEGGGGGGG